MNTIIENYTIDGNKYMGLTEDNNKLNSLMASLARNNTFFPNITNVRFDNVDVYVRDDKGHKVKDENGKNIKKSQKQMTVRFADGTWVILKLNPEDNDDAVVALLYAIAKRLFGEVNESGYVNGSQFMKKLKNIVDSAVSSEKEAAAKEKRAKEKAEADKIAHEDAVRRRKENPSLRQCVKMLYDKLCSGDVK